MRDLHESASVARSLLALIDSLQHAALTLQRDTWSRLRI
jgi:hypothetical protein